MVNTLIAFLLSTFYVGINSIIFFIFFNPSNEWYKCVEPKHINLVSDFYKVIYMLIFFIFIHIMTRIIDGTYKPKNESLLTIMIINTLLAVWSIVFFGMKEIMYSFGIIISILIFTFYLVIISKKRVFIFLIPHIILNCILIYVNKVSIDNVEYCDYLL